MKVAFALSFAIFAIFVIRVLIVLADNWYDEKKNGWDKDR